MHDPFKKGLRIRPSQRHSAEIIRFPGARDDRRLVGFKQITDRRGRFVALEPQWVRVSAELRRHLVAMAGEGGR